MKTCESIVFLSAEQKVRPPRWYEIPGGRTDLWNRCVRPPPTLLRLVLFLALLGLGSATGFGQDVGQDVRYGNNWTFYSLGFLSGQDNYSVASGLSADPRGPVVSGYGGISGSSQQPFLWTTNGIVGTMVGLGSVPAGTACSGGGISSDGSVVVGFSGPYGSGGSGCQAWRWTTQSGTMTGLGYLPGGSWSRGYSVSADGSVVVGYGDSPSGVQGWRWTTQSGSMQGLGYLPGSSYNDCLGVSRDGSTVAGAGFYGGTYQAWRWTQSGSIQGLGFLSGASYSYIGGGNCVSGDGSVIVGRSGTTLSEAFRCTLALGMQGLGYLQGDNSSGASGISADGSVIVGYSGVGYGGLFQPAGQDGKAVIWENGSGPQNIQTILTNDAVNLSDWTLQSASAVFATNEWQGVPGDYEAIAGVGYHNGNMEAWLAIIPEPSTYVLAVVALGGLLALRRRRG